MGRDVEVEFVGRRVVVVVSTDVGGALVGVVVSVGVDGMSVGVSIGVSVGVSVVGGGET